MENASSLSLVTSGLEVSLTTSQSDALNPAYINPLRLLAGNYRLFGSRTRHTSDPDKRFTTVNRLQRWTAHSLTRSLAPLAAVSSNDESLWAMLRSRTESHLQALFQDGALVGSTPSQAFFVRCDATTTSPADLAVHQVGVLYGLAPLRPSGFIISRLILSTADPARPLLEVTPHRPPAQCFGNPRLFSDLSGIYPHP